MPNHVFNLLQIESDNKEALDDLVTLLGKQYKTTYTVYSKDEFTGVSIKELQEATKGGKFSFHNIVPAPLGEGYDEALDDTGGASQGWYEWNRDNWDTKWDAYDVTTQRLTDLIVSYDFTTAWSPPMVVIETLAKQYPDMKITFTFTEENGWGAEMQSEAGSGELVEIAKWDEPNSHSDYVARHKEYQCVCSWGEGDDLYADCPREEVNA
jgi:hypothetical protein